MPESLRLFALAKRMKWAHLPLPGGIYDQHPRLIDQWTILFGIESEVEKKRQDAEKRQQKQGTARPGR